VDLVLLDQFQRARRRLARIELVVAHEQLDLAAGDAALVVDQLDRELCALDLILGLGGEGAGQRRREADADGFPCARRMPGMASVAPPAARPASVARRVVKAGPCSYLS
jgi:hypothetical protein